MKLVGELLARRGVGVATGAFGGIGMRAPAEGAAQTGTNVPIVGYTYGSRSANKYVHETVDCHEMSKGLPFDADYCLRLAGLLSSDAFIVAAGGGPGTFLELIATINFNQKFWTPMKKVAILDVRRTGTWDHSMLNTLKGWGVLNDAVAESIRIVDSAEKAVRWTCEGIE